MSLTLGVSELSTEQLEELLVELKGRQKLIENELYQRRHRNSDILADCGLSLREINRFSRHLLLHEFGVEAQMRLSHNKRGVLVVGAGGLGCPALQYLAASGVGRLGVVDHDQVDLSNLHRQILHTESKIGIPKAESAKIMLQELNSDIEILTFNLALDSHSASEIVSQFDAVLDCSDNVATRYLLNDACVLNNIPLVSGSALRFEGQLTVYNYKGGPTYRCLYPTPPSPDMVTNCSDGGVLGPVPGVIGTLQAVEAIKVLSGVGDVLSGKLLLYDALTASFRTIKLRERNPDSVVERLIDYEQFCGTKATDKDQPVNVLQKSERISAVTFSNARNSDQILIDVRSEPEMTICALENSLNVPIGDINKKEVLEKIDKLLVGNTREIVVVCRRGNDSQLAVQSLQKSFAGRNIQIRDIIGGLHSWARTVDPTFPVY